MQESGLSQILQCTGPGMPGSLVPPNSRDHWQGMGLESLFISAIQRELIGIALHIQLCYV